MYGASNIASTSMSSAILWNLKIEMSINMVDKKNRNKEPPDYNLFYTQFDKICAIFHANFVHHRSMVTLQIAIVNKYNSQWYITGQNIKASYQAARY